eukprot:6817065-Alexandrium_andersonii.AAC.1
MSPQHPSRLKPATPSLHLRSCIVAFALSGQVAPVILSEVTLGVLKPSFWLRLRHHGTSSGQVPRPARIPRRCRCWPAPGCVAVCARRAPLRGDLLDLDRRGSLH